MYSIPNELINVPYHLSACAKVNVRLKVTGRRADGYHTLSMLNAPISILDNITVRLTEEERFTVRVEGLEVQPELTDPDRNLASRAARAVLNHLSVKGGVEIDIIKKIPIGAGCGGGSSDAGHVLSLIWRVLGADRCRDFSELIKIALTLGADVPYFLDPKFSWVTGIGEEIQPLPNSFLRDLAIILFVPSFSISTEKVFKLFSSKVSLLESDAKAGDFVDQLIGNDSAFDPIQGVFSLLENDLIQPAITVNPNLEAIINRLRQLLPGQVGMTGSGSATFALIRKEELSSAKPMLADGLGDLPIRMELAEFI